MAQGVQPEPLYAGRAPHTLEEVLDVPKCFDGRITREEASSFAVGVSVVALRSIYRLRPGSFITSPVSPFMAPEILPAIASAASRRG